MQVKFRLKELMREWEHLNGEDPGKLTYRRLSELTGIDYPRINDIANNKQKQISVATISKLCDFFKCQPGDLFTTEEW